MDNYTNTPLSEGEIKLLKKEFLAFSELFPIAFSLFKRDWLRSGLKPVLWSVAIGIIFALIGVLLLLLGIFGITAANTTLPDSAGAIAISVLIGLILIIAAVAWVVALIYVSYSVMVRTYLVLNNKNYNSIWSVNDPKRIKNGIYNLFLSALLLSLISSAAAIPFLPISVALSLLTLVNESLIIVISVLNNLVSLLPAYLVLSVFGYTFMFCLFENVGPINSLKASFNFTKPYYFQNIVRYIPIAIPGVIVTAIFYALSALPDFYTSSSYSMLENDTLLTSASGINQLILFGILMIVGFVVFTILYILYSFVVYYYNYVGFLNIRMIQTKKEVIPTK